MFSFSVALVSLPLATVSLPAVEREHVNARLRVRVSLCASGIFVLESREIPEAYLESGRSWILNSGIARPCPPGSLIPPLILQAGFKRSRTDRHNFLRTQARRELWDKSLSSRRRTDCQKWFRVCQLWFNPLSVIRHQFLSSQQLLCQVTLDIFKLPIKLPRKKNNSESKELNETFCNQIVSLRGNYVISLKLLSFKNVKWNNFCFISFATF